MQRKHATIAIFTDQYEEYQKFLVETIAVEINKRGYGTLCVTGRERGFETLYKRGQSRGSELDNKQGFSLGNEIYELLKENNIKGLISFSGTIRHNTKVRQLAKFMQQFRVPQVSLGLALPNITSVLLDDDQGMTALMNHLITETEAKNFAFVRGLAQDPFSLSRERIFRKTLNDSGYAVKEELIITGNYDRFETYQAVSSLLHEYTGAIDAIVAANDLMALSAARSVAAHGALIPRDIVVTGYDDTRDATLHSPALTTVRQPISEIARVTANLLFEQSGDWSESYGDRVPQAAITTIGTELVIRGSSKSHDPIQIKDTQENCAKLFDRIEASMRGLDTPANVDLMALTESLWLTLQNGGEHLSKTLGQEVVKNIDPVQQHWWNNLCFQIESVSQQLLANHAQKRSRMTEVVAALAPVKERSWALTIEQEFESQRFQNARNELLSKMSSCSTLPDILATLDKWLRFVKPRRCYLVRYETPSFTPDKRACLIHSSYDGTKQNLTREWFDSQELLPPPLTDELNHGLLLLSPVFTGDTHFGYILFDPTGLQSVGLNEVSLSTGNALRNRYMLSKLEQQTEHLKRANSDLVQLASFDPLTGLPNRRQFHQQLDERFQTALAENTDLCVLFVDLDGFKHINDSLGHNAGDQVLKTIASRIERTVDRIAGTDGFVSRLGGDEFTVIVGSQVSDEMIERLAREILQQVCLPCNIVEKTVAVSASIGYSTLSDDVLSAETMLNQSDSAMYRAKSKGKSCVLKFSHAVDTSGQQRQQLDARLRIALTNGDLVMHYQPRIDLSTGNICSAEALMRWIEKTEDGPVVVAGPDRFIPIAEESGLINELDKYALQQCCQQIRDWEARGIRLPVSVNLSISHLQQEDFEQHVLATVDRYSIDPSLLEFEIIESAAMIDVETNISKLKTLRSAGIKLSIDDFGTGYSSLYYLKKLPVDNLKIDRSFIMEISPDNSTNKADTAIVRSIVALGKSMGIRLVAEGVETEHQHRFVKDQGCDEVQGFYFHKPMPAEDLEKHLTTKIKTHRAA